MHPRQMRALYWNAKGVYKTKYVCPLCGWANHGHKKGCPEARHPWEESHDETFWEWVERQERERKEAK